MMMMMMMIVLKLVMEKIMPMIIFETKLIYQR